MFSNLQYIVGYSLSSLGQFTISLLLSKSTGSQIVSSAISLAWSISGALHTYLWLSATELSHYLPGRQHQVCTLHRLWVSVHIYHTE